MTNERENDPRLQPSPRGVWIYADDPRASRRRYRDITSTRWSKHWPHARSNRTRRGSSVRRTWQRPSKCHGRRVDLGSSDAVCCRSVRPLAALIVASASMLGDFTRPYLRWGIYTSSRAITAATVGAVAIGTSGQIENRPIALAVSTIVAAVVAQALDCFFASITVYLRRRGGVAETARLLLPVAAAAIPLYAPLVALLAIGYDQLSAWATMLFFVPALAAQRLYKLYQQQRHLTEGLTGANARLESANLSFAAALVATLDARDQYTAGHSAAVAVYSRDIAMTHGTGRERTAESAPVRTCA